MDTELLKVCGVAVLCAVVGALLGRAIGGISVAVRLAGLALVFGGGVMMLGRIVSELNDLGVASDVAEYSSVMLKGLAIATVCRICADVCRDCGEPTVASAVESAGKLSMLLLAMPFIGEIADVASELIERI